MRKFNIFVLLIIVIVPIGLYHFEILSLKVVKNFMFINVVKNLAEWEIIEMENNLGLGDGIPDGWDILSWGNAKASYYLTEERTPISKQVAVIERSNNAGGAAFIQTFSVKPNTQILASVLTKGDGGILQIQFRSSLNDPWGGGGWKEIESSSEWSSVQLSVIVPSDVAEMRLLLRSTTGIIKFDNVYAGIVIDHAPGSNLVINPKFEKDGSELDPILWWNNHILNIQPIRLPVEFFSKRDISYLNIVDTSYGNFVTIKNRLAELDDSCALVPEGIGWLLVLGQEEQDSTKERIFLLAIELAPKCPEPYAALANLYASRLAYKRAADLYHIASNLSEGTLLAGRYAFEEGFIHIRYTGKTDNAILSLKKATQISGWERGSWYRGAAFLYLGFAYEAKGMDFEAKQAYQRVIDCKNCTYHHFEALRRLEDYQKEQ